MTLGYHDLADIKLRHALRQSRLSDVALLLEEVDELRDAIREVGSEFGAGPHADADVIVQAIRDGRADEEASAAQTREHEAFERGCFAVAAATRADQRVRDLLGSPPLANPGDFCSMCGVGHADEYGLCGRHGKKVRDLWQTTEGPTQGALVLLVAFAAPLFELIRRAAQTARPKAKPRFTATRKRYGR